LREYNTKERKMKCLPNEGRLTVDQMSIEQTHLILMVKGPEADEFNMEEPMNLGNFFTKAEYWLINVYFFCQDGVFRYYVLYFGISVLGFTSHELFYSFHLLDVVQRFNTLGTVILSVTSNAEQLLMTGLLTLVVIYIFTVLSFFYL
jgi:hypothetical protein